MGRFITLRPCPCRLALNLNKSAIDHGQFLSIPKNCVGITHDGSDLVWKARIKGCCLMKGQTVSLFGPPLLSSHFPSKAGYGIDHCKVISWPWGRRGRWQDARCPETANQRGFNFTKKDP